MSEDKEITLKEKKISTPFLRKPWEHSNTWGLTLKMNAKWCSVLRKGYSMNDFIL